MNTCPYCQASTRQSKAGQTESGSQRYQCQQCKGRYTPQPKTQGYPDRVREQAVKMYVDGLNYRRIGRLLGVDHVSVMNWVRAHASQLPSAPPQPDKADVIEMDELIPASGQNGIKKQALPHYLSRATQFVCCGVARGCAT